MHLGIYSLLVQAGDESRQVPDHLVLLGGHRRLVSRLVQIALLIGKVLFGHALFQVVGG